MLEDLQEWQKTILPLIQKNINENGNSTKYLAALEKFPEVECDIFTEDGKVVISSKTNTNNAEILSLLREFMPWRKGPWKILGVDIDTEWRSNLKWERLEKHICFREKKVLDIGCGNGYYAYRTVLSGAKFVLGIDPSIYSYFQAQIPAKLCSDIPVCVLPLAQNALPNEPIFDVVFSMGVYYHHKNPVEHLSHIYDLLLPNGEIILETLIVEPDGLKPKGRYAKMRNVYEIPSVSQVENLLKSLNFGEIKVIDITKTTTNEQRKTAFMDFESLADFLDPNDEYKTIENYPAPVRAVFLAKKL
jgi:tRNA (mo5U34)-methyltransferase